MISFKIGEKIKWESIFNGISFVREGKIVYIVFPFTTISEIIDSNDLKDFFNKNINIINNDKEKYYTIDSYLVLVGERDGKIPNIHWPNPNKLQKVIKRKINRNKNII